MASTYIERVDSTDGNRKVWTWSAWVKRDVLGSVEHNMFSMGEAATEEAQFKFSSDQLSFFNDYATTGRVSATQPSRKFRDINGWYHFVWRHKVDEASNDDRWKIYINGERLQPSDYGSPTIPNEDGCYNRFSNRDMWFGARAKAQNDGTYQYFSGLMSHIHFCDGYAYDATDFGEYDANGVWKIKTSPSVNYGTHGFFILKDGNSVTDQSGNGNDCTVGGGTLTNTEDNPSNVFATLNPLTNSGSYTFANGNTALEGNNTNDWSKAIGSTLAASSGKYYWEVKQVSGSHTDYNIFGFMKAANIMDGVTSYSSGHQNSIQTAAAATVVVYGQSGTHANYVKINGSAVSISDNDIVSFALDLDNRKCWLAKNGVWVDDDSGNTNGSSINSAYPLWNTDDITADTFYMPISVQYYDPKCQYNFGNGYFGTTAVSSAGTNASGIGIFEYDVPTGYTALSTKGLNL